MKRSVKKVFKEDGSVLPFLLLLIFLGITKMSIVKKLTINKVLIIVVLYEMHKQK